MIKISITGKHFLIYLSICVLTIVSVAMYSYYSARKAIMTRTFEQLTSVRVEKSNSVERFFNDRMRDIEMVAGSEAIHNMFGDQQTVYTADQNELRENEFATYLNIYLKSSGYYNKVILLPAQGGLKCADLRASEENIDFRSETEDTSSILISPLIERIKRTGKTCFQDYQIDKADNPTIYVGTMVHSVQYGNAEGIVILEISVKAINAMMFENNPQNGLGSTGEAYIVGSDYLIRTASRFQDHSIFRTKVTTTGSRKALAGTTGTEIILDYRGISVLSSFSKINIPDLNWVILAEMDTSEAMIPIYTLRNDILLLALIIFFMMGGIVYVISRKMTLPIIRLQQATSKISSGEYKLDLQVSSQDELGALTEAFNHMAAELERQSEQIRESRLKRLSSMIDGQEMERQRLSRDLHDSLGQSILAVKMKLEQARQTDPEKSRSSLMEALDLIRTIIQEVRTISHDLMPPVLEAFGIAKGLNTLCKEASSGAGISITFEATDIPPDLDAKTQIYLYRIAQEAVHNITKHSHASNASIILERVADGLHLCITDDGCGFNFQNQSIRANGINNILERVELLGGICTFATQQDRGTIIDVKIPIAHG